MSTDRRPRGRATALQPVAVSPTTAGDIVGAGADHLGGRGRGRLRRRVTAYLGAADAATYTSFVRAIYACLEAIKGREGVEDGGILLPRYSCPDFAHAIDAAGLTRRYCDVDPGTLAIDAASLESTDDGDALALLAVNHFGLSNPMDRLVDICADRDLYLVEDLGYSIGAEYRGTRLGGFGDFAVLNFREGKAIPVPGGMVTTRLADVDLGRVEAVTRGDAADGEPSGDGDRGGDGRPVDEVGDYEGVGSNGIDGRFGGGSGVDDGEDSESGRGGGGGRLGSNCDGAGAEGWRESGDGDDHDERPVARPAVHVALGYRAFSHPVPYRALEVASRLVGTDIRKRASMEDTTRRATDEFDCDFEPARPLAAMSNFDAALGRRVFDRLDRDRRCRNATARYYREALADCDGVTPVRSLPGARPHYIRYPVLVDAERRADLLAALDAAGIEASTVYHGDGMRVDPAAFPGSARVCRELLTLPTHPRLDDDDRAAVVETVRNHLG